MDSEDQGMATDLPLAKGEALSKDKLARRPFAESAVRALRSVSASSGFSISIEGTWGSGKTSILAMIHELMDVPGKDRPMIVRFNPWMVGDREALLRQFLDQIAATLGIADHTANAKKVSKELTTYSKALAVAKLIPGLEPWASIAKSLFESFGKATDAMAELKSPTIEDSKNKLAKALQARTAPIVVLIDDIDRLFPPEVFEMVRIIKAVGDLPNVGYVVAWDAEYVAAALKELGIPNSETYLDKIIQVRMAIPRLGYEAKVRLINENMEWLPSDAISDHFHGSDERFQHIYHVGLRDLLEQPRDFARVFNTVKSIEPSLRGEIAYPDIIALATLMVKAPPVFKKMQQSPQHFVGRLSNNDLEIDADSTVVEKGRAAREAALSECAAPEATRKVLHAIFPEIATAEDGMSFGPARSELGHIGHRSRLTIALQLTNGVHDVSMAGAKRFLTLDDHRDEIIGSLTQENCIEFIAALGDLANSIDHSDSADLIKLCVAIARIVDSPSPVARARKRVAALAPRADLVALETISRILDKVEPKTKEAVAESIVRDARSLSAGATVIANSFSMKPDRSIITVSANKRQKAINEYSDLALEAAAAGTLLSTCQPEVILWTLGNRDPKRCKRLLKALRSHDPTLDDFALAFFKHSFFSDGGQSYSVPQEPGLADAFWSPTAMKKHAQARLKDDLLKYPARAAWQSVLSNTPLFGKDGRVASR